MFLSVTKGFFLFTSGDLYLRTFVLLYENPLSPFRRKIFPNDIYQIKAITMGNQAKLNIFSTPRIILSVDDHVFIYPSLFPSMHMPHTSLKSNGGCWKVQKTRQICKLPWKLSLFFDVHYLWFRALIPKDKLNDTVSVTKLRKKLNEKFKQY